jgi:hypothetical protein
MIGHLSLIGQRCILVHVVGKKQQRRDVVCVRMLTTATEIVRSSIGKHIREVVSRRMMSKKKG